MKKIEKLPGKYCLIGARLSHSYSSIIHKIEGLDYRLVELAEQEVRPFLMKGEYDGINITFPYKKLVANLTECSDKAAFDMFVVNTAKKMPNGDYASINTDVGGLRYTIERLGFDPTGKNAIIFGTGGAATTAEYVLKRMGAKRVYFVSRQGKYTYENYTRYKKYREASIIINATPVGTYPAMDTLPFEPKRFTKLEAVIDLVYNPSRTELLYKAEKAGLAYSNGLPMLVEQALLAKDFWKDTTHRKTHTEKMIKLMTIFGCNIILSGMPSCGKTTVGKELARICGREFVDLDQYITQTRGKTPAELIAFQGEKMFREIEKDALAEVCIRSGLVIALGGGTLSTYGNPKYASMNGVIIYIKRPLRLLSTENRPISQKVGVRTLYEKRRATYEKTADAVVLNDDTKSVNAVAREVLQAYESACIERCKPKSGGVKRTRIVRK